MTTTDVTSGGGAPTLKLSTAVIGLAVALVAHFGVGVAWASDTSASVRQLDDRTKPLADGSLVATLARLDERTARMDKRSDAMAHRVERLEAKLLGHSAGDDQ